MVNYSKPFLQSLALLKHAESTSQAKWTDAATCLLVYVLCRDPTKRNFWGFWSNSELCQSGARQEGQFFRNKLCSQQIDQLSTWEYNRFGNRIAPEFLSPSHAPQKDERGGVKLDVNNLLSVGSLSRTLDRDPRGESSPQVFHHSAQWRLVNSCIMSKDEREDPFIVVLTLPTGWLASP